MPDHEPQTDFDTLVRNARMEGAAAIGDAIGSMLGAVGEALSRANTALWHHSVRPKSRNQAASARR